MDSITFYRLALRDAAPAELREAVEALVTAHHVEDQWLEFKSGAVLRDPTRAATELRKQVSGFANADGGALVIGVAETARDRDGITERIASEIDGCHPQGGNAHEWVSRVLVDLPTARPRVHQVNTDVGVALVIAVDRAPVIVPCPIARGVTYYLRIGDSTHPVPKFLEADLMLGRRQRPQLALTGEMEFIATNSNEHRLEFFLRITVRNDGLLWVPRYQMGVAGLVAGFKTNGDEMREGMPPEALMNGVDAISCRVPSAKDSPAPMSMRHVSRRLDRSLAPFDEVTITFRVSLPRIKSPGTTAAWCGAAYVAPENGPPTWAQIVCRYDVASGAEDTTAIRTLRIDRPVIWWGADTWYLEGDAKVAARIGALA